MPAPRPVGVVRRHCAGFPRTGRARRALYHPGPGRPENRAGCGHQVAAIDTGLSRVAVRAHLVWAPIPRLMPTQVHNVTGIGAVDAHRCTAPSAPSGEPAGPAAVDNQANGPCSLRCRVDFMQPATPRASGLARILSNCRGKPATRPAGPLNLVVQQARTKSPPAVHAECPNRPRATKVSPRIADYRRCAPPPLMQRCWPVGCPARRARL